MIGAQCGATACSRNERLWNDTVGSERSTDKTSYETLSVDQRWGGMGLVKPQAVRGRKTETLGRGFESLPCYRGSINRVAAKHFAVCACAILQVFFPFRERA
jgi:hypothetical protein